jgi:predicted nucleic acid-binding protein
VPFLIDINIAIHARDGTDSVLDKLAEHDGEVLLSSLSLAELQRGVFKDSKFTALRQARLDVLLRGAVRLGQGSRFRPHDCRACDLQRLGSGDG